MRRTFLSLSPASSLASPEIPARSPAEKPRPHHPRRRSPWERGLGAGGHCLMGGLGSLSKAPPQKSRPLDLSPRLGKAAQGQLWTMIQATGSGRRTGGASGESGDWAGVLPSRRTFRAGGLGKTWRVSQTPILFRRSSPWGWFDRRRSAPEGGLRAKRNGPPGGTRGEPSRTDGETRGQAYGPAWKAPV